MNDAECVSFLQWALPRLAMRWKGFRRVRRQVRRRINVRLAELGLADGEAYRRYLEDHPAEWTHLDGLCRVTVSRFLRNRGVWMFLFDVVLPELARRATARGTDGLRIWCAGCASGEEPYTLAIGWRQGSAAHEPRLPLEIVATDADAHMLERARSAEYPSSSLRELPQGWREAAFERTRQGTWRLRPALRAGIVWRQEDVRHTMPDGPFDLVLCRNLVCTYFEEALQRRVLAGIADRLVPGGALVLGHHERLPSPAPAFEAWDAQRAVYRRIPLTEPRSRSREH